MKIESVRIENLRTFADVTVPFDNYACLVGPNGAGKSTILCALNIFFRESENVSTDLIQLDLEDFHRKRTENPIRITVTFKDLSDEAKQDFSDYFRQEKLVVSAVATFDEGTQKAEVKQYGQRLGMKKFAKFFVAHAEGKRVSELKEVYGEIKKEYPDLPKPGTKDSMTQSLRDYEAAHPDLCELILSEDQFYGFSKGQDRLAKHVQWVYIPAVKDPTTEQTEARNSALGKLLARTVRSKIKFNETIKSLREKMQKEYQTLLDENQDALDDISEELQKRLVEWSHPDATLRLRWKQDPDKSVRVDEPWAHIIAGEADFEGELARFGHGFQRSYLFALLQELAVTNNAVSSTLILACEEPELYQHPPQVRHLADILQKLSEGSSQVIVSTHNPLFVSGEGFESVRMVRKEIGNSGSSVSHMSYDQVAEAFTSAAGRPPMKPAGALAKIHQIFQSSVNEMFFAHRLIFVEGLEDVAYILTYLELLGKLDDYRRIGCHIVPVNGKSQLLMPLIIAKHMNIPTYVVFDADSDQEKYQDNHKKDNKAILSPLGEPLQDPLPDTTLWGSGFTMWHSNLGSTVKNDIGEDKWKLFQEKADSMYGQAGNLKKNSLHIGAVLALAWEDGKQSENLKRLCEEILKPQNRVPS